MLPILARVVAAAIMPAAVVWAKRHERAILRRGSRLSTQQLADAVRVGVEDPDRVRVLFVERVPPNLPRIVRRLAARLDWGPATTAAMALGHGIFVRTDQYERRDLLIHELVHTAQYERLGFRRFLRRYVRECLTDGYASAKLETEAARITAEVRQERLES